MLTTESLPRHATGRASLSLRRNRLLATNLKDLYRCLPNRLRDFVSPRRARARARFHCRPCRKGPAQTPPICSCRRRIFLRATDFQATQNAWRAWSVMSSGLLRWVFRRTGYEVCCASTTRCVLPPHMAILECSMHARESKKPDNLCTMVVTERLRTLRAVNVEANAVLPGHLSLQSVQLLCWFVVAGIPPSPSLNLQSPTVPLLTLEPRARIHLWRLRRFERSVTQRASDGQY